VKNTHGTGTNTGARKLRTFLVDRGITTILLDEKSMFGQQQLGWTQLRAGRPRAALTDCIPTGMKHNESEKLR
jgi:hypothetical protein